MQCADSLCSDSEGIRNGNSNPASAYIQARNATRAMGNRILAVSHAAIIGGPGILSLHRRIRMPSLPGWKSRERQEGQRGPVPVQNHAGSAPSAGELIDLEEGVQEV